MIQSNLFSTTGTIFHNVEISHFNICSFDYVQCVVIGALKTQCYALAEACIIKRFGYFEYTVVGVFWLRSPEALWKAVFFLRPHQFVSQFEIPFEDAVIGVAIV